MADNIQRYGFRPFTTPGSQGIIPVEVAFVASAAAFNVTSGAQGVGLRPGDVVKRVNDGSVTLCEGTETSKSTPYGVVVGILPFYNATKGVMDYGSYLPSGTTYTIASRQSRILVTPFEACPMWECDCDDNSTATTLAGYEAFVGENVDFINKGASGETKANPRLDISSHATTNTLNFRIREVSRTRENADFTGNYVKLIVSANVTSLSAIAGV
jgi:hypothetical protein